MGRLAPGTDSASQMSQAAEDGSPWGATLQARRYAVRGVVQGVGFRPFVYRLAHEQGLAGWVRNTSWGVEIEVQGATAGLNRFGRALQDEAPPLARIESVHVDVIRTLGDIAGFQILESQPQEGAYQLISPDIATCADCLREILDPADRRYRYPFTNCTNCGPRFTIIAAVPYDRPRTTMRAFRMCPACQREYDDPGDRRFHAQPNACPVCGPHLTLLDAEGREVAGGMPGPAGHADVISQVAALLRQGAIVAIKGLGGYQLACDATDEEAVGRLRQRKRRPDKPFAVMVVDLASVAEHARPSEAERKLLSAPASPIVLLPWSAESTIAPGVAPRYHQIGIMLPYTPLHHLLLGDVGRPLVMTSGNLSEEPIARDNDEAVRRLRGIADYFLVHDRDIHSRYDDSVWFVPVGGAQPIRRARGYAPFPVRLPFRSRPILACGAELKNTFCLTRERHAFLSQHIGDMENLETAEHYAETLALYKELFHIEPEAVAVDLHPDYMATRYGLQQGAAVVRVQHHHAHLASCLADSSAGEDGADSPAIGVIMDGTGYGLDGQIWGGEFLVGDGRGFQRAAHLQYLPLPGGDQATRKPYRIALAYVLALLGHARLPETLGDIARQEGDLLAQMLAQRVNTPLTSSAGRLFDAVSALLGVCREVSYEAQAAIALEMAAGGGAPLGKAEPYPYALEQVEGVQSWGQTSTNLRHTIHIQLAPLLSALLDDLGAGTPAARSAWRFHVTMAEMMADVSGRLCRETGLERVALSGGCFQNRLLLQLLLPRLQEQGAQVLMHRQAPCNDGGLSLGQAVVAHYRMNGD